MHDPAIAANADRPADLAGPVAGPRQGLITGLQVASERWNGVFAAIGGVLILVQVGITSADVVARYVFNRPIEGAIEVQQMLLAYVALVPVAYTLITGGHVRFTLLLDRFRGRTKALFEILSAFLGLIFFAALAWGGFDSFLSSWLVQESMVPPLPLPYWLPKFFLPFGAALMLVQLIIIIAREVQIMVAAPD